MITFNNNIHKVSNSCLHLPPTAAQLNTWAIKLMFGPHPVAYLTSVEQLMAFHTHTQVSFYKHET